MNTPSDDLFLLIKSLNKSEKGYFKKFAGFHERGAGNNYLRLFDAIDKQENFDEEQLKTKFRGEKFLRQLPVAKNYLYQVVMRALEQYHADTDAEIFSLYRQAAILFQRNLFDQSSKLIHKAKVLALKNEKFQLLLLLLRLEWSLYFKKRHVDAEMENERLIRETNEAISALHNMLQFQHHYVKFYTRSQVIGHTRTRSQTGELEKLIQVSLMDEKSGPLSLTARSNLYKIMATYGFSTGSNALVYEYTKKLIGLIEENYDLFRPTFSYFLGVYGNLANACIGLGKFTETRALVKKLRALSPANKVEEVQQFEQVSQIELEALVRAGLFAEGVEAVKQFEKEFQARGLSNPSLMVLLPATAAYIEFGAGNFKSALKWINIILNKPDDNLRSDVSSFVRLFDLMVHYELGNTDLLEYKVRSAYRYLLKKKNLFSFEQVILHHMKKLIGVNEKKELLTFFSGLKDELLRLEESHLSYMKEFDLITWLESKISGKPFAELVLEKRGSDAEQHQF